MAVAQPQQTDGAVSSAGKVRKVKKKGKAKAKVDTPSSPQLAPVPDDSVGRPMKAKKKLKGKAKAVEVTPSPPKASAEVTFESLGVCEELCQACKLMKWYKPSKIQVESIPWALQGRDIIGLAETGSGKTGAFAIPIVQRLLDDPQRFFAICLAPTRELCVQIGEQFEAIGSTIKLQTATIVGGLPMIDQAMALAKRPHVVCATPGRLVDHLENTKGFHLKTVKYVVMDEADRLLSMDFDEALDKILDSVPKERNTFLFSATMTSKVSKLQRASLTKPVKVEVNDKTDTVSGLVQNCAIIPFKFKQTWLAAVVSHFAHYAAIVFTDTCLASQRLSIFLRHMGMDAVCLHGQMNQSQRLGALSSFKSKEKRILVCTDVASRGLDVPCVDLVVNYDIPKNSKDYIHRVGRTARAGRSGRSMTLVTQYDIELFQRIEHFLGKKLDEFKEITEAKVKGIHERTLEALRSTELEIREQDETATDRAVKRKMHQQKSKKGRQRKN